MKKVLALVLAVIMVCTMAMAVTIDGVVPATPGSAGVNSFYRPITPGKSIILERDELGLETNFVKNADGSFAPEKNAVEVTFDKGAELIASKGWVKTAGNVWKYVITTKADEAAVLDSSADIIISKVTVTRYGIAGTTVYNFAKEVSGVKNYVFAQDSVVSATKLNAACLNADGSVQIGNVSAFDPDAATYAGHSYYFVFNYGRTGADFNLGTSVPTADNMLYTVKKVAGGKAALPFGGTGSHGDALGYTLKAGEKVIFGTVPTYALADLTKALQSEIITNDVTVTPILEGIVVPNKAVTITVNSQKEGAALYMVNADGTLTNLGAKFDANGVLTATAKITGAVILTDKAMTASNVITPGTTTNPGTGANDVVGVAAALAVVALVSGAAISLKK